MVGKSIGEWRAALALVLMLLVGTFALANLIGSGTVAVLSPANDSYANGSINISLNFSDTVNITIEYNSTGEFLPLNATTEAANSPYNFTWVTTNGSFDDGVYGLRINVTNATNVTDNLTLYVRNVTIDNNPPVFGPFISPTASARYKDGQGILINVTVNDTTSNMTDDADCFPRINDLTGNFTGSVLYSSVTRTCNGTITLSTPSNISGAANITVRLTDNAGNTNTSTNQTIVVDNSAPAVTSLVANKT